MSIEDEDKIAESLGLVPLEDFRDGEIVEDEPENPETTSQDDYEYARQNMRNVIENGADALNEIVRLAKASDNPLVYETITIMMKSVMDANKDLIGLDKSKVERFKETTQNNGSTTNNIVMAGTTSDLKKLVDQLRNKDQEKSVEDNE